MKCEHIRLKALGSGCFSIRATRAPERPSRVAAAQPARLPPTTTASYAGRSPMMGEGESELAMGTSCLLALSFVPYYTRRIMKIKYKDIKLTGNSYAVLALLDQ